MTSPYLNNPKRSLGNALKDRGMAPNAVGLSEIPPNGETPAVAATRSGMGVRVWILVALVAAVSMAIGISLVLDKPTDGIMTAEEMKQLEKEAGSAAGDIMPASGPEDGLEPGTRESKD